MGRGKLKLELIPNEKSRKTTFQKRKKGMMKKAYEFSVLCDIDICLFISGPKSDPGQTYTQSEEEHDYSVIETFPPENDNVLRIIQKYQKTLMQRPPIKNYDLSGLFTERNKKVHAEISRSRKKYYAFKYPTCAELIDGYSADELAELVGRLDQKIEIVKKIIDDKKKENQLQLMVKNENAFQDHYDHTHHQQLASLNNNFGTNSIANMNKSPLQLLLNQTPQFDPSFSMINSNSMMVKLLGDDQSTSTTTTSGFDDHDQFRSFFNGTATTITSNTMQYYGTDASTMRGPVYEYPTAGVMHENSMMMFNGNGTGTDTTLTSNNSNMQYGTGTSTFRGPIYNDQTAGMSFEQYMMMFNGTGTGTGGRPSSSFMQTQEYNYPPLMQPIVPYMQYPMNVMNVGPRLGSFQVTPASSEGTS